MQDSSGNPGSRNHQTHFIGHCCQEKAAVTLFHYSQESSSQEMERLAGLAGPHAHLLAWEGHPDSPRFVRSGAWGVQSNTHLSEGELIASQEKTLISTQLQLGWIPEMKEA